MAEAQTQPADNDKPSQNLDLFTDHLDSIDVPYEELSHGEYEVIVIKGEGTEGVKVDYIARVREDDSGPVYESLSSKCPIEGSRGDVQQGLGNNQHVLKPDEELSLDEVEDLSDLLDAYGFNTDNPDDYNPEEYPERIQFEEGTIFRYDGTIKIRRGTLGEDIHTRELGTHPDQQTGEFLEEAEEEGWGLGKIERQLEAPERNRGEEPSGSSGDRKPENPSLPAGQRFGA